jgi:phage terminase large subunit GpA-like protein
MQTWPEARAEALQSLLPPPQKALSAWIEKYLILPSDVAALPGRVRLSVPQRGIADAISDPAIERVSVLKGARVGYTTLMTGVIASYIANDPTMLLVVVPTEADARDFVTSDIERIFAATPCLRDALTVERGDLDRNTLLSRRFPGGSLKVVAAKSPRNLRRHNVRILLLDEIDEFESDSGQGDIMRLAERRTLSFSNRKIICGSTPISTETSYIMKAWEAGDQRVFECPCPSCGSFSEIVWAQIRWDEGKPETAKWVCPLCGVFHDEKSKPAMVHAGRWKPTRPEIKGHASFRLSALTSLLPNASWPTLATEFVSAKHDADRGTQAGFKPLLIPLSPSRGPVPTRR